MQVDVIDAGCGQIRQRALLAGDQSLGKGRAVVPGQAEERRNGRGGIGRARVAVACGRAVAVACGLDMAAGRVSAGLQAVSASKSSRAAPSEKSDLLRIVSHLLSSPCHAEGQWLAWGIGHPGL